jgi:hypothetical protein
LLYSERKQGTTKKKPPKKIKKKKASKESLLKLKPLRQTAVADNNISKTFTGDVDSNGKKAVAFISMSINQYNKKVAQKEFTAQSIVAYGACKINKQVVRKALKRDEGNAAKNFGTGDKKWNGGLVKHPNGSAECDGSCPDGQVRKSSMLGLPS